MGLKPSNQQMVDPVHEPHQRLLEHMQQLARPRHARWDPIGLMAVRAYLSEQLGALGPVEQHRFCEGIDEGTNLILRLPGQCPELDPLLVAAHYDGPLHSIGADDNASGLATLIELARHWAAQPPRRLVLIVAFDQEEWGILGSTALARELKASRQKLRLMVSLKMLAYTSATQTYPIPAMRAVYGDRGDFIAVVGYLGASAMLPGLAHWIGKHVTTKLLPVPDAGRSMPNVRLSDHSPFWDEGYNAVMVTDNLLPAQPAVPPDERHDRHARSALSRRCHRGIEGGIGGAVMCLEAVFGNSLAWHACCHHGWCVRQSVAMASLTIRNLDEGTKAQLRLQAACHGRSMEEEAPQGARAELGLGSRIHAHFAALGGAELDLPERTQALHPALFPQDPV